MTDGNGDKSFEKDNKVYFALARRCQGSKTSCPGLEAKFATCNSVRVRKPMVVVTMMSPLEFKAQVMICKPIMKYEEN